MIQIATLVSSGGIVTVLTYMQGSLKNAWMIAALIAFLIALLFFFILLFLDFFLLNKSYLKFSSKEKSFNRNELSVQEFIASESKKFVPIALWTVGCAGLFSIFFGIACGLIGFFI